MTKNFSHTSITKINRFARNEKFNRFTTDQDTNRFSANTATNSFTNINIISVKRLLHRRKSNRFITAYKLTGLQTVLVLTDLLVTQNSYYNVFHINHNYNYLRRYCIYIYEHELVNIKEESLPYLVLKQKKLKIL